VLLQVLLASEVFLLACFAEQTMLLVEMLAHVSCQSHGEGNGYLTTLVNAHSLDFVVRHHLGIHIADVRAFSPELEVVLSAGFTHSD